MRNTLITTGTKNRGRPISIVMVLTVLMCVPLTAKPLIIFDTDMDSDFDDAGALAVLHALADNGECEILAVMHATSTPWSVGVIDAINTYYHRGDIPIGDRKKSDNDNRSSYAEKIAKDTSRFKHNVTDLNHKDVIQAKVLYKQILSKQKNKSVTIVTVGPYLNLLDLLNDPDAVDLIAKKVKLLSIMGGYFNPAGHTDWNVSQKGRYKDGPKAGKAVIERWPTPVMWSDVHIGVRLLTGERLQHTCRDNPVREAYRLAMHDKWHHHASWDQSSVLFAVRGLRDYWYAHATGRPVMYQNQDGKWATDWLASPDSDHSYLMVRKDIAEMSKIIEDLMIQPPQKVDTSNWKIKGVYKYLGAIGDELSQKDIAEYCQFMLDCQEPKSGNFTDKYGEFVYSVKAYYTLKRFGYTPKYPLSVCEPPYRNFTSEEVSEHMSVEGFRQWLDYIYKNYDAYGVGSLRGHFIHPHVMNLEKAGKTIADSPYIPVFKQWLLNNQGENGFWNRPGDPDYSGWNGVMKMDSALRLAKIELPRQDRMIRTVLKYQSTKDGSFTAAGGCTNHNALHTLRQWSKRNDLLMWGEIFRSMEFFTESLQRRWDPQSGYFRPVPGFNQPPQFRATELAGMATGNVIEYCRILLKPENKQRLAKKQVPQGKNRITAARIQRLLVQAKSIDALACEKIKEHLKKNIKLK